MVLLLGAWSAYPLYPTTRSICDLIDARDKNPDRWATPHRGAVILLTGDVFAVPEGQYAFRARCRGHELWGALATSPMTLASSETRSLLRDLPNPAWRTTDRYGRFTIAARVDSEVQS